jgi:signal transduction histidine kinase/ActR/RegA family two-component response regulator
MATTQARPGALRALASGLAFTLAALALQWGLRPLVGEKVPFLFFLPAIGVAAMWWGWRAAILVMAGGFLNAFYWFSPEGQPGVEATADRAALAGYLVSASVLLALGARLNHLRRRAAQAEARLAQQLQELQWLHALSHEQQTRLREADRRKDEFLATLAHELRNPLAPIRQAAMIARSPAATEPQKRRSQDIIERQVRHMALLLDDLLDVSRITRGKLELRREPTPLAVMVEATVESSRPLLDARRQQLQVQLPTPELWLDADPMRVEQVLTNLLGNAAKYGRPGGQVLLSARREGGTAVIEVRDDGIGIPPEALDSVFEMFTQLPRGEGRGAGGLGIGLALSRGLAVLHGGSLVAHSAGPGQGSTFTLTLPLDHPPPPAPAAAGSQQRPAARRRILVADDNRDAAETLAEMLRMSGHEVSIALDGEQALQSFRTLHPDAALLDIGMPGMTGNEVAQAIRALPEGRDAMLVAITGWGQDRDREATRHAGFDHHLTKPVDPDRLEAFLESVFAGQPERRP